jgi:4-hydroxybenzoate polyprenyltransferase
MDYSTGKAANSTGVFSIVMLLARTARPRQWVKNLVVYVALFFTVNESWIPPDLYAMLGLFARATAAFGVFCLVASSVYIVNDIFDADKDRNHPRKKLRPIASGLLPVPLAWVAVVVLGSAGLAGAFLLNMLLGMVVLIYVLSMYLYTLVFKHIVLLDVMTISAGFVIRVVAGAVVIGAPISPWLYICTGLAALMMALAKRRSELVAAGDNAVEQRGILEKYTTAYLDQAIVIVATSSLLAYSLYTFSAVNLPRNGSMMLTIPFVAYMLFRYLYLVHLKNFGENMDEIITDRPLLAATVLWLATVATVLGLMRP